MERNNDLRFVIDKLCNKKTLDNMIKERHEVKIQRVKESNSIKRIIALPTIPNHSSYNSSLPAIHHKSASMKHLIPSHSLASSPSNGHIRPIKGQENLKESSQRKYRIRMNDMNNRNISFDRSFKFVDKVQDRQTKLSIQQKIKTQKHHIKRMYQQFGREGGAFGDKGRVARDGIVKMMSDKFSKHNDIIQHLDEGIYSISSEAERMVKDIVQKYNIRTEGCSEEGENEEAKDGE